MRDQWPTIIWDTTLNPASFERWKLSHVAWTVWPLFVSRATSSYTDWTPIYWSREDDEYSNVERGRAGWALPRVEYNHTVTWNSGEVWDSNRVAFRLLFQCTSSSPVQRIWEWHPLVVFSFLRSGTPYRTASSISFPLNPESELCSWVMKWDRYDSGSDMKVPPITINSTCNILLSVWIRHSMSRGQPYFIYTMT